MIGLKIKLDRPVDHERPCCLNVCTIGAARGPHAGELKCVDCGQHRGQFSKSTAQWIGEVMARFGAETIATSFAAPSGKGEGGRLHATHNI